MRRGEGGRSRRTPSWISVTTRVPAGLEEAALAAFAFEGSLGVETRSSTRRRGDPRVTLVAWYSGRRSLAAVTRRARRGLRAAGIPPAFTPRAARVADRRWVERWQRSLRPMRIGRRFLALPEGCRPPRDTSRFAIRIPFGQAFGTGEHASTRLCLRLMEGVVRGGDRIVDLGTGTGILSVAAARLGAGTILAIDDDPIALRVAGDTMRRNGVEDLVSLRQDDAAAGLKAGRIDLALVNIGATVIERLLPGLAAALAPGGRAIFAGILIEDEPALSRRARDLGLMVARRLRQRPWSALLVQRASPEDIARPRA